MSAPTAHMASRIDARNAPDFFPTPPWATRALCEELLGLSPLPHAPAWDLEHPHLLTLAQARLLPHLDETADLFVWEMTCGEGHMALPLTEYFNGVFASDLFDRGFGPYHGSHWDFLAIDPAAQHAPHTFDWLIFNPPFGEYPQKFVERAFEHRPRKGVAVFVPLRWLETIDRTLELFLPTPPSLVGIFAERVPLHKGRYEPDGKTATAYCWVIWRTDASDRQGRAEIQWIPPGAAKRHFRASDLHLAAKAVTQEKGTALPLLEGCS